MKAIKIKLLASNFVLLFNCVAVIVVAELEEFYRVSHKQICNWADRFDAEGVAGLQIRPGRGRKSIISSSQKEQLKIDLQKSPEFFGYNMGNWSGPLVQSHLKSVYFIAYSQSKVYKHMYDLGFSFQRPRAKYPERDKNKREIAKVDIKKTLEYCAENPDIVVLCHNEFSLSNTATLSATWALKGNQPEISCKQAKKERKTGFGTVEPNIGQLVVRFADAGNSDTFKKHLKKVQYT